MKENRSASNRGAEERCGYMSVSNTDDYVANMFSLMAVSLEVGVPPQRLTWKGN